MNDSMISIDQILEAVRRAALTIQANEAYLNELDAVVGDGEHGFNLSSAFQRVVGKLADFPTQSAGDLLRAIGRELVAAGGGAGTTFYGTAFMAAGKLALSANEIDAHLLSSMMEAGLDDIRKRGNAAPGDKTMIDALFPAVEAVRSGVYEKNASPCEALKLGAKAAFAGVESTKSMLGKKGRSLYAGERALGTPDPGATSAYLILASLAGEENISLL